jgi:hypothetical protein
LQCKLHTHPLVREGSLHEEGNNCHRKENLKNPVDTKANWPTDRRSQNQLGISNTGCPVFWTRNFSIITAACWRKTATATWS